MSQREFEYVRGEIDGLMEEAQQKMEENDWSEEEAEEMIGSFEIQVVALDQLRASAEKSKKRDGVDLLDIRIVQNRAKMQILKIGTYIKKRKNGGSSHELLREVSGSSRFTSKLPKLVIDKFDGDIFKFHEFWQMFEANVHSNPTITNTDKFNYLASYLTGKAKNCIAGIPITGENYPTAVDRLQERFGNVEVLISHHYRALTELPPSRNYTSNLRNTFDAIEKNLRCLQNFGENINQRIFPTIIKSKFPPSIIFDIEKSLGIDESLSTEDLLQRLKRIIGAQERVYLYERGVQRHENSLAPQKTEIQKYYSTTETLLARENRQPRMRCFYCEESHYSDECSSFTTLEARRERARGRCFNCLNKNHRLNACRIEKPCVHCKEVKKHHRSLCPKMFAVPAIPAAEVTAEPSMVAVNEKVFMQTFQTVVKHPVKATEVEVRGILDSGSQRTYITENLCKLLKLDHISKEILTVYVFGSVQPRQIPTSVVELSIRLTDGSSMTLTANVVPSIMGNYRSQIDLDTVKLPDNLELADVNGNKPIEILIGNDYYYDLVLERKENLSPHLYLVKTKVGWVLSGRKKLTEKREKETVSFLTLASSSQPLNHLVEWLEPENFPYDYKDENNFLKSLWDLETLGIRESPYENDDDLAVQAFNSSIQKIENRYFVSWPWKCFPPVDLASNYGLAIGRLKSLLCRIRDREILGEYSKIFDDQLSKGVIEKVDDPFKIDAQQVIHYLPHHPVITPEKTTKVRIVFDGSAKSKKSEKSLNQCMYRGRILLEDLAGILMRVRMHKFIVTSDIEKAFLQIGLHEQERDVTRFIWVKDFDKPPTSDNLLVYRFCRVAFGIISSPFLLNAVVRHHLGNFENKVAGLISRNIYVDNVVVGCDTAQEGIELYERGIEMFQEAKMNLRCWVSNVPELREKVRDESQESKILGVNWVIGQDSFVIKSKRSMNKNGKIPTKREIVSYVASFFDPLGFLSPILIRAKLFIQELWQAHLKWEDPVNLENLDTWKNIQALLEKIPQMKIPRFIGRPTDGKTELHCFTDASQKAYSATVYVRYSAGVESKSKLIFSKARVAPKNTSIPRLELLGVVIGVRTLQFISGSLDVEIEKKFVWTDSKCVLFWIKCNKVLPLFVENRVKEIKRAEGISFRYVPSKQNPADVASRGTTSLPLEQLWWEGPSWLREKEESWPPVLQTLEESDELEEPKTEIPSLPSLTELVIAHYHKKLAHAGVSHTLAEIRRKYWIIRGRSQVRRILKDCLICQRWAGGPYRLPDMPPLPLTRTSQTLPFRNTGLDYLGPLYVRSDGRSDEKVWICLFTCLVTRALHLELVLGLTAREFLFAIRRFVARRGSPAFILSDNASQFHLVESVVNSAVSPLSRDSALQGFLAEQRIEWQFIPEFAPWAGGVYERLVGLVKSSLRKTIGKKKLGYDQLSTFVVEVENILNGRPITYVSDDVNSNDILTPSHFLQIRSPTMGEGAEASTVSRRVGVESTTVTRRELIQHWRQGQALLENFWKMWKGQYLLALRERRQTVVRQQRVLAENVPRVGAIVQIGGPSPRGSWRLARIVELKPGRDGKVRSAQLRLPNQRLVTRSIGHLYPLEVPHEVPVDSSS